jgi:excisionase family DNA binding protein
VIRKINNQLDNRLAYSMQEVADLYGVSDRTVYTWIKTGKLRAIKVNRLVRIPREAVAELLEVGHG